MKLTPDNADEFIRSLVPIGCAFDGERITKPKLLATAKVTDAGVEIGSQFFPFGAVNERHARNVHNDLKWHSSYVV